MAIRMQQRRGTEEQWTLTNPVLGAGEIGFETDTGQFKMGDGVARWNTLGYFLNSEGLEGSLDDYVPLDALGDTVATLVNGQVPAAQLPDIGELSQDAVNDALTAGTGITKDYNDAANTLTLAVDTDTIATRAYVDQAETDAVTTANSYTNAEIAAIPAVNLDGLATEGFVTDAIADIPEVSLAGLATETFVGTAIANLVDTAPGTLDTLNELAAALGDDPNFATTVATQIGGKADSSHTHAIADVTNLQTGLDAKAPLANPTFTGTVAGVTKAHVGLGNVDNTTDAGKPVSTAQQTALDLKANIASPTFTGTVSGNASAASTAGNGANALGFKGIPVSGAGASGGYTLVAADSGEMVYTTTTRTVTIPSNASVPFEIGTSIVFVSGAGATTTIAIATDTMRLAGSGATGSRTLSAHGMATAVKVAATTWYISGSGLV